jgi:hypothetical protein
MDCEQERVIHTVGHSTRSFEVLLEIFKSLRENRLGNDGLLQLVEEKGVLLSDLARKIFRKLG